MINENPCTFLFEDDRRSTRFTDTYVDDFKNSRIHEMSIDLETGYYRTDSVLLKTKPSSEIDILQYRHVLRSLEKDDQEDQEDDVSENHSLCQKRSFTDCNEEFQNGTCTYAEPNRSLKKIKHRVTNFETPKIVLKQMNTVKSHLTSIFQHMYGMSFIEPHSKNTAEFTSFYDSSGSSKLPTLLFTFNCSDLSYLGFFEFFTSNNINVIAITPEYKFVNDCSFPIILDKNGTLSKLLNVRDPVGGGIFSIPAVILFSRFGEEICRIKLGYDFNVYYDDSENNNLQTVLQDLIAFAIRI